MVFIECVFLELVKGSSVNITNWQHMWVERKYAVELKTGIANIFTFLVPIINTKFKKIIDVGKRILQRFL